MGNPLTISRSECAIPAYGRCCVKGEGQSVEGNSASGRRDQEKKNVVRLRHKRHSILQGRHKAVATCIREGLYRFDIALNRG